MGVVGGDGAIPDAELRNAEALFFVEDLEHPVMRDEDTHHLVDVLRPRVGQYFALSDGRGSWRKALIVSLPKTPRRSREIGRTGEELVFETGPMNFSHVGTGVELIVAFAMPKGERLDLIVQKLTELGIDQIVPLVTRRTVVRLGEKDRARRKERLVRVAREACSQSRRLNLPLVTEPETLEQFLKHAPQHTVFAEPGGAPLDATVCCVIIGPEGGFDPGEVPKSARRLGLGPNVLRVETAAISVATLMSAMRSGVIGAC
ncbi:MAG TPA: RsmE family RNA methyltransferase [Acidimicrobiales bacterium]|nr:RsmE family RNA methyltransferase [Acidimicrobiales bacterium]